MDFETLLLQHLPTVDGIVRFIARRHHLSLHEADELSADIRLKLIENDYAVLRRFEGRCNLRTYLMTVIQRHFLDVRIAGWGKWRPSTQARRLGPVAVLLDRLITRDGLSFNEATETLRVNHAVTSSVQELSDMHGQLPQRQGRRFVTDDQLDTLAGPALDEQALLAAVDGMAHGDRVETALTAALQALAPQDQLLLKMHFVDGLQVASISRALGLDQKSTYKKLDRLLAVLRQELEERGIRREHVAGLVGHPATDIRQVFAAHAAKT